MRGNGALQKYYLNRNTKATPQDISQKCKTSSVPNTDLIHTGVWQEILLSNFGKKIGVLLAISWLSWALIGPSSNFPSFSLISPISQKSTELLDMSILPKTFHKGIFFFLLYVFHRDLLALSKVKGVSSFLAILQTQNSDSEIEERLGRLRSNPLWFSTCWEFWWVIYIIQERVAGIKENAGKNSLWGPRRHVPQAPFSHASFLMLSISSPHSRGPFVEHCSPLLYSVLLSLYTHCTLAETGLFLSKVSWNLYTHDVTFSRSGTDHFLPKL